MISTADCKQAIVAWLQARPGHVQQQFTDPIDEAPSLVVGNWKRIVKEFATWGPPAKWMRTFDCRPYDDQLRAYVWDDGQQIVGVEVLGE